MVEVGPFLPVPDSTTFYAYRTYALVGGRWFVVSDTGRDDSATVTVAPGEDVPEGFSPSTEFWTVAEKTVPLTEVSAFCAVRSFCTWKNTVWTISHIDKVQNVVRLQIANGMPKGGFVESEPIPAWEEFVGWPGVEALDREWTSVQVRPAEMARVQMDFEPFAVPVPPIVRLPEFSRNAVMVDSLPESPWLPPDEAIAIVRQRISGDDMGGYPVELLQADRLRDGWRVWAPPPPVDDPRDIRLGWAVWYVADDGLMWASSTSTPVEQAQTRMTDQLFARLQETRRSSADGRL